MKKILFFLFSFGLLYNLTAEVLVFDKFDSITHNTIGGWTSIFQQSKSFCRLEYVSDDRGYAGYSAKVTMHKADTGFSGFWVQTLDFKKPKNEWKKLNLKDLPYKYLSFQIKPLTPGSDFIIKIADTGLVKKEDSVRVGLLSRYGKFIVNQWQEVLVPLKDFQGINCGDFAEVAFESINPGTIQFLIDDICLKASPGDMVENKKYVPVKRSGKKYDKAMWVWHEQDFLTAAGRKALLDFCRKNFVNVLFCQVRMQWRNNNREARIIGEKDWRNFIRDAHKNKIQVHMLDGYKEFAKVENHIKMLSQVKAVIDFNSRSGREEQFDGIHHDNEVYLCSEWQQGIEIQKNLLVQSLLLIKKIKLLIQKIKSALAYGVDIPFWYDQAETEEGDGYLVNFDNQNACVVDHFIRLCDNVGIMDYRNFAAGPDGIITHGIYEVKTASRMNKKSIFIGLETIPIEPRKITFDGMTKIQMQQEMDLAADAFAEEKGFRGFAIHHYRTYNKMEE